MIPSHPHHSQALLVLASAGLLALAGCGGEPSPPPATYELSGEIYRLPDRPGGELFVRHEAIPDFVNHEGEVDPMPAMTMGFGVADGVDLTGFEAGDPVAFTFEMTWSPPRMEIVRLEARTAEAGSQDTPTGDAGSQLSDPPASGEDGA